MTLPLHHRIRLRLGLILGRWSLRAHGVAAAPTVKVLGLPIVARWPGTAIVLHDRCTLCSWSAFTALGVSHPVILRTLQDGARIEIGRDTGISGATICSAAGITIGDECLIGADVMIVDTDFHPLSARNRRHDADPRRIGTAPVSIGNNVFIGARSIVLKGVTIGDNAVIGAGSVVTSDIPPDVIAAGNPCRVLGALPADA